MFSLRANFFKPPVVWTELRFLWQTLLFSPNSHSCFFLAKVPGFVHMAMCCGALRDRTLVGLIQPQRSHSSLHVGYRGSSGWVGGPFGVLLDLLDKIFLFEWIQNHMRWKPLCSHSSLPALGHVEWGGAVVASESFWPLDYKPEDRNKYPVAGKMG